MSGNPNTLIGFTDDGKVFLAICSTYEGKPLQTAVHLSIHDALNISDELIRTVQAIRSKGNGGNGANNH